jgi:hypothetical protein
MDETTTAAILVGLYLLGVASRIVWPFALAYLQDGARFDYRYIIGQVVAGFVGLVPMLASADLLTDLGVAGLFGSFAAGFGAGSIGRTAQKTVKR